MEEKKKYYITTPIYYPSGKWHIGTCYTTIVCDALARFKRMQGYDTFYLTGTDEHGKKIQTKAQELGITEKQFIDPIVNNLKDLWKLLDISYDKFIRTTDDYHEKAVQGIFQRLYDQGDIYKAAYEGWYCVPCESFWTKAQLVDGKCPDCGRDVELTQEESYFFRMSKYTDRLTKLLKETDFLEPQSRVNEMYNNFLKEGLQDLAVSRTSFKWGIQVPFDTKHIIYVWIDALTNYITALGYGSDDTTLFEKFWPAEVHMMGKEIIRFHSLVWPAILMALDIPLPKKVYGHGWLLMGNDKISKSKGNIVDPFILSDRYGVDALRYYLLREIPFGSDGAFSNSLFLGRINADLCNNFGNLTSRTLQMITAYCGGIIPAPGTLCDLDREVLDMATALLPDMTAAMDSLDVPVALEKLFAFSGRCNKYIDETAPWTLAKSEEGRVRLNTVLYVLAEGIRTVATLMQPYLTKTPEKVFASLGITDDSLRSFDSLSKPSQDIIGLHVERSEHLFRRYDIEKETAEMEKIAEDLAKKPAEQQTAEAQNADGANTVTLAQITIDEFFHTALRVAKVTECEKVPKADKLLKLTLDIGGETRTVVSGIAKHYTPEEMVGKRVVLVYNLQPAKLRGITSEGMILCAVDDEGGFALVTPERPVKSGAEVC